MRMVRMTREDDCPILLENSWPHRLDTVDIVFYLPISAFVCFQSMNRFTCL
jgi:hypothetical protein